MNPRQQKTENRQRSRKRIGEGQRDRFEAVQFAIIALLAKYREEGEERGGRRRQAEKQRVPYSKPYSMVRITVYVKFQYHSCDF